MAHVERRERRGKNGQVVKSYRARCTHLVEDSAERTKRAVDAVFGHQTPEPEIDEAEPDEDPVDDIESDEDDDDV